LERKLVRGGAANRLADTRGRCHRIGLELPLPDSPEGIKSLRSRAQAWSEETSRFLLEHSPRAATAFQHMLGTGVMARVVDTPSGAFSIDGPLRHQYEKLMNQLGNLRGIAEKPEAYF